MKTFNVWAPEKESMILHIISPFDKQIDMHKNEWGCFSVDVDTDVEGLRYYYQPDGGKDFPDPASEYQPEGVHGPSQVVSHDKFSWNDGNWKGLPLNETILYELHIGTFTPEGTFDAAIGRLDDLNDTGINAIEVMPVAQFPGNRNWGYDGVFPYAVQESYGGPDGLKRFVDACHTRGIAVYLDVVYNHVGPEGNYLSEFGPYFTKKYSTPWGNAINFDGDWSDGVRDYFSDNIIFWMEKYHIDGLRFDAIHAMYDNGAVHFWELVNEKIKNLENRTRRKYQLIAESDLNSPKVVTDVDRGGFGFDAQWLDDFHHALYKMINTHDDERYYDFGKIGHLSKAFKEGFVHSGEWVKFRKRKHGASSANVSGDRFVAFNLNHDQAGNRAGGERLCMLVDANRVKLAAAALFLSPYVPMLFMGEEYADDTPFFYFVSHSDEALIKAVREGRKAEFEEFGFDESVPDPQEENTFTKSIIHWEKRNAGEHKEILDWHRQLITLRKTSAVLKNFNKENIEVQIINDTSMALIRHDSKRDEQLLCLFNFSENVVSYSPSANAVKILDSREHSMPLPEQITAHQVINLQPLSAVVYRT